MAKRPGTNGEHSSRKAAPPRANDAERLAALRWLAMRIEQLCIELYVTDRDTFNDIEDSLRAEVRRLQAMAPVRPIAGEECPDGYVLCRDGLCAPMCFGAEHMAAPHAGSRKPKR